MAFDGYFCAAVAAEIQSWTGAKVEKIHQSAPSCLYLCLYRNGCRANLILSVSAARPMLAVTTEEIARPNEPTALCMLFRKHLQNARILSVDCVPNERIVRFRFESADELGFLHEKTINAEMMGKYSNLILVNEQEKIATSTADLTASVRQVMPGMPYESPPPQEKQDALRVSEPGFRALAAACPEQRLDRFLVQTFYSVSPVVARELAFRASGRTDPSVGETDPDRLWNVFAEFADRIRKGDYTPCAVYEGSEGVEYSYLPLTQYGDGMLKTYPSFSELQSRYFARQEETVNLRSYAADILRTARTLLAREQKKYGRLEEEMKACGQRETFRRYGDLLTASLYALAPGMPFADVTDFATGETVRVPMDVRLTPARNAQAYYKKYAKMKRAETALAEQILETERRIGHLESILYAVDRAQELSDLAEIRREMAETGLIRTSGERKRAAGKGGKKEPALSRPLRYRTTDGKTVLVGKNNLQNDALDASAAKNDLWFHIKKYHGSHVILVTEGEEPTDRDYTEAAMLAAYHSEKRGSRNVEVDYTRVKNLRKPSGSPPGFVTYETYYSAVVDAILPPENGKE